MLPIPIPHYVAMPEIDNPLPSDLMQCATCSILLSQRPSCFVKGKINDGTTLPKNFYWSRIGPTVLSLRWNTGSLAKLRGRQIEFAVTRHLNYTVEQSSTAKFSDGEVTLDSLVPDSLYVFLLTAKRERNYTFKHFELARTLRPGKPICVTLLTNTASRDSTHRRLSVVKLPTS